jgi:hypothetical protein
VASNRSWSSAWSSSNSAFFGRELDARALADQFDASLISGTPAARYLDALHGFGQQAVTQFLDRQPDCCILQQASPRAAQDVAQSLNGFVGVRTERAGPNDRSFGCGSNATHEKA